MPIDPATAKELSDLVFSQVAAAVEAGMQPGDPAARPVVSGLVTAYATAAGREDSPEYRRELLAAARIGHEPRAERYWQLMAVINGWPEIAPRVHLWAWFVDALSAHGGHLTPSYPSRRVSRRGVRRSGRSRP